MAALVRIHEAVGHPAFGLCLDAGNLAWHPHFRQLAEEGQSAPYELPRAALQEAAHRFTTIVVKDCVLQPAATAMVQPGSGLVDLKRTVATLCEAGFDGPLLIEKLPGTTLGDLDANMSEALEFCRELIAGASRRSSEIKAARL